MGQSVDKIASRPAGSILFVCADRDVIPMLSRAAEQFALSSEVQPDAQSALEMLGRRKYEAVVVDLQLGDCARTILRDLRFSPANGSAVTFTITTGRSAGESGMHCDSMFVFRRPLTEASINLTLKAAYGLILRERRRYFRCPVSMDAILQIEKGQEHECETVNIGEGGIALKTALAIVPRVQGFVRFTLPDQSTRFGVVSLVRWRSEGGCIGLQFLGLSAQLRSQLFSWLSTRFEATLPEHVAAQFRHAKQP